MSFSLLSSDSPKRTILKRFPVLFPLGVFILIFLGYQALDTVYTIPSIGIVQLNGIILESESTIKKLRMLEDDPTVKGIIIHINSPGGAVSPSQEIFSEILRLKQYKMIYASISSTAASGGYYVAVATDRLFANPGSMVGSIGVIIQTFNIEGLMDKLGIQSEVIKSGKNKDVGSIFRQMRPEEKALLENVVSDTHEQFINAVAANRSVPIAKIREIADGRVFTGNQAHAIGLIDQIASFRETAEQMRRDLEIEEKMKLVYPTDTEDLLESIIDLESLFGIRKLVGQAGLYYLSTLLLER
jgi:protease-4